MAVRMVVLVPTYMHTAASHDCSWVEIAFSGPPGVSLRVRVRPRSAGRTAAAAGSTGRGRGSDRNLPAGHNFWPRFAAACSAHQPLLLQCKDYYYSSCMQHSNACTTCHVPPIPQICLTWTSSSRQLSAPIILASSSLASSAPRQFVPH